MSKGKEHEPAEVSQAVFHCLASGACCALLLIGCGGSAVRSTTPFLPPVGNAPLASPTPLAVDRLSLLPTLPADATAQSHAASCHNDLQFLEDLTIPDGTLVAPGAALDKQWRVKNSGDCNWDERYRLRLVNGNALGAEPEQALYPARAGAEAVLRILFTAPLEAGTYYSEWQAYAPDNTSFGDPVFLQVIVSP